MRTLFIPHGNILVVCKAGLVNGLMRLTANIINGLTRITPCTVLRLVKHLTHIVY